MTLSRSTRALIATTAIAALVLSACTKKNESTTASSAAPASAAASGAASAAPGGESGASGAATSGAASGGATSGDKITVAFVPKIQGSAYFEAMNAGAARAETDLGNVKWLSEGPVTADAASQAEIVRKFVQQKVDVLVVAPNDPDSMAPALQEAQDAGIKVMTADTDAPNSVREVFVNQATAEGIGTLTIDTLMEAMGGKGEWAIVSCGETAENLNSWIEVEKAVATEKFPDAKLVDVVYSGEDVAKGTQMATDLMNAHPNLTGLVGQCTTSAEGVAQAVKDSGNIGKVFSVGVGTPLSMAPFLQDGASSGSILWDVEELGYLTAWAGVQLAEGKPLQATNKVSDKLPAVTFDSTTKMLLLGDPLLLTKENVGNYQY